MKVRATISNISLNVTGVTLPTAADYDVFPPEADGDTSFWLAEQADDSQESEGKAGWLMYVECHSGYEWLDEHGASPADQQDIQIRPMITFEADGYTPSVRDAITINRTIWLVVSEGRAVMTGYTNDPGDYVENPRGTLKSGTTEESIESLLAVARDWAAKEGVLEG